MCARVPPPAKHRRVLRRHHQEGAPLMPLATATALTCVPAALAARASFHWAVAAARLTHRTARHTQVREWPETRALRRPPPPPPQKPPPPLQLHPHLAEDCADWLRLQPHTVTCDPAAVSGQVRASPTGCSPAPCMDNAPLQSVLLSPAAKKPSPGPPCWLPRTSDSEHHGPPSPTLTLRSAGPLQGVPPPCCGRRVVVWSGAWGGRVRFRATRGGRG
jgi:hypothetical protein